MLAFPVLLYLVVGFYLGIRLEMKWYNVLFHTFFWFPNLIMFIYYYIMAHFTEE